METNNFQPNAPPAVSFPGVSNAEAVRDELQSAVQESQEVLMQASNFSLFPDTVTLDRIQITVTKRQFFGVSDTYTLRVEDILNVEVAVGPIFGSLKIFSRVANIQPCAVRYLWRSDAERLKHITHGYMVAVQKEIDCSGLSTPELINHLQEVDLPE